jgi:uncharacterized protein
MPKPAQLKRDVDKIADILRSAGGRVVGRTRLQKLAYLLEIAGVGEGFPFAYRHFGPYSEELTRAANIANIFGVIKEEERPTSWGGAYSIFTVTREQGPAGEDARTLLARTAVDADPVELELAATAAFLALQGQRDPWEETQRRKPEKAEDGRLEKARQLHRKLKQIQTPRPLPDI